MLQRTAGKGRWDEGVFLGVQESSGELIVGNTDGTFRCRDYRPKVGAERFNIDRLNEIVGVPWETVPGQSHDDTAIATHIPIPRNAPLSPTAPSNKDKVVRRTQLYMSDVIDAGLTKGCPGCECILYGEGGK